MKFNFKYLFLSILVLQTYSIYPEFGFIIPTYIATEKHKEVLIDGIKKIRSYHDNPIVLIDDHSPIDISDIKKNFSNLSIETSIVQGAGEMNPYLHFYMNKYFDIAVILHDSMHLNRPLQNIETIKTCQFIRHFTRQTSWRYVKEPETEYNKKHNIKTHEDLILHLIKKVLSNKNTSFLSFCLEKYYQKDSWVGCFGIQTIIKYDFLIQLQKETNILDFALITSERRRRMAMESIFALACHFLQPKEILEKSFDGIATGRLITENFSKISLKR